MHKQCLFKILFACILTLAALCQLSAQVTTATISGTVTDASGAVVAGATIQVKNAGTDISQK